jgi:hypothetical protein
VTITWSICPGQFRRALGGSGGHDRVLRGRAVPSGLATGAIDVHLRQVLHLLFCQVDLDALGDPGHGVDRNGHLLAAPQMPLLQQHVRHVMAGGVDDQPFDLADVAVGGINVLAALHLHLARGDRVVGLRAPR